MNLTTAKGSPDVDNIDTETSLVSMMDWNRSRSTSTNSMFWKSYVMSMAYFVVTFGRCTDIVLVVDFVIGCKTMFGDDGVPGTISLGHGT